MPDYKTDPFEWNIAQHVEGPGGELKTQMLEPIKVVETIQPIAITNPKPDGSIFRILSDSCCPLEISVW